MGAGIECSDELWKGCVVESRRASMHTQEIASKTQWPSDRKLTNKDKGKILVFKIQRETVMARGLPGFYFLKEDIMTYMWHVIGTWEQHNTHVKAHTNLKYLRYIPRVSPAWVSVTKMSPKCQRRKSTLKTADTMPLFLLVPWMLSDSAINQLNNKNPTVDNHNAF